MDFKKLLEKIDSLGGKQLNESKEDYEYYFGKDKKDSGSKERETDTGHMAKKTDKGTQYTKKDLPGQDTSKDADTKRAEKRAKKDKVDEAELGQPWNAKMPVPPPTPPEKPGMDPLQGMTLDQALAHPKYKTDPKFRAEVDKALAFAQGLKPGQKPVPSPLAKEGFDFHNLLAKLDYIAEAKKEEMDEEKTEEGNEFSGQLAKAKASGADEFEVDGKKYPVKETKDKDDIKEEDDADDEDDLNESVEDIYEAHVYHRVKHMDGKSDYQHHKTFKDEEEAQDYAKSWNKKHGDDKKTAIVKLKKVGEAIERNPHEALEECYDGAMMQKEQESGLNINASTDTKTGNKSLTVTASGDAADELAKLIQLSGLASGGSSMATGPHEMEEEYANTPEPEIQGIEVQMQQGNDLNRPKTQHQHSYRQGDNPMAMREARELAEIEQRLNEELAAFKVVAEGSRVKEPSGNYRDPHTGRLYSSPDGKDGNDGYRTPEYMLDFYKEKLAQIAKGPYKRTKEVAQLKAKIAKLENQGVAEGKGKKPDFLDMDKDGDKKEPMKKALADKSKKK